MSSLPTKAELLKKAETLPYHERIQLITKLALAHKDDPKLKELIAALRDVCLFYKP